MTQNIEVREKLSKIQNIEQLIEIIVKEEKKLKKEEIQKIIQKQKIQKKLTKSEKLLIQNLIEIN